MKHMHVCSSLRAAARGDYGCSDCLLFCFTAWMDLTIHRRGFPPPLGVNHVSASLLCLTRNGPLECISKSSFVSVSISCKGGFHVFGHTLILFSNMRLL